eukprot:Gb_10429 [translate_table: standard]
MTRARKSPASHCLQYLFSIISLHRPTTSFPSLQANLAPKTWLTTVNHLMPKPPEFWDSILDPSLTPFHRNLLISLSVYFRMLCRAARTEHHKIGMEEKMDFISIVLPVRFSQPFSQELILLLSFLSMKSQSDIFKGFRLIKMPRYLNGSLLAPSP